MLLLTSSVTRRLSFLLFVPYLDICNNEKLSKMTKVGSIFCQMPNKPSSDRHTLLKSHQSGENSPNLVTLLTR